MIIILDTDRNKRRVVSKTIPTVKDLEIADSLYADTVDDLLLACKKLNNNCNLIPTHA